MRTMFILGAMIVAGGAGLETQDLLNTAKDLYASAAYEDALTTLNRVDGSLPPDVARQVDEYRAFCLYALGRTDEAESIAESIIRQQPLARLSATDVSPRLELMFTEVRWRLLPSLIRDRFRLARAAFDQQNFADAEPHLVEAHLLIYEATTIGISDDTLVDLGVLIDGFLQLIRSTADRRPRSQPRSGTSAATAPPPSSPAVTDGPRIYSIHDRGVVPPVAVERRMPALTPDMKRITQTFKVPGILSIVIAETGRVEHAALDQSMNPAFDTLILDATREWKYVPAKKDGVAVRYLTTVALAP